MIPIKCFTCGNVLADKYRYFKNEVERYKSTETTYLDTDELKKTPEGKIKDNLLLNNVCCRRHMLTHVDIK